MRKGWHVGVPRQKSIHTLAVEMDTAENWGRAARRGVRATTSTVVTVDLCWIGGSNGGVGVISWVLHHHRRDGLWKQKGAVGHSVVASSDDDMVAFFEGWYS